MSASARGALRWFGGRLASALIAIVGVVTAMFAAQRLAPGDPVDALLGEHATAADRDALRERLGLHESLAAQYGNLWLSVLDGSLGYTFEAGARRPVSSVIAERLPPTVELAVSSVLVAIAIAFPLGVFAATRAGGPADSLALGAALIGVAVPSFWLGPALIYLFAVRLQWLPDPVAPSTPAAALVLPALSLGAALAGKLTLMVRSSVLEVLREPFVLVARAKGLSPRRVLWVHVLRNASLPVVTLLGLQLAALLTGALVTEKVFARPGVGTLLLEGVSRRDYAIVQGVVVVLALVYVAVNLLTDLAYALVDPRVRLGGGATARGA
jgi:peptide/nickel transport system permease protein